ncbi:hydrolase [Cryptosporidium sp. chipmunk genotype I]|uniref:hydrolase n=1 Tax=Cryptosporidium sp. chipmunk genotype I TaxID=1280935 RepID=UPI00351A3750|nr:hydrolase [Cryptosporidium sp. chipmunk genotype I]
MKMKNKNYLDKFRSFVIVIHEEYGCLLLKSSKKGKYDIFQLPGGRLDEKDLMIINSETSNDLHEYNNIINMVPRESSFKIAAARELYEETGLDFRNRLDMLKPLEFDLPKKWRFFYLNITNFEMVENQDKNRSYYFNSLEEIFKYFKSIIYNIMYNCFNVTNINIRLSKEHESFLFEKDLVKASELVKSHSKGFCAKALLLFKENYKIYTKY